MTRRRNMPRSPRLHTLRRQRILKRTLFAFMLAAVAGLLGYALSRPVFFISEIAVGGGSRIPEESVLPLIKRELSGKFLGVIPRSHILLYSKTALTERLLSRFPLLASVELSVNFQSLQATLTERVPVALWCITELSVNREEFRNPNSPEKCFYMDKDGFVFSEAPPEAHSRYDRFVPASGFSATSTALLTKPLAGGRLGQIRSLLRRLEAFSLTPSSVRVAARDEFSVIIAGGGELRFREAGDFEETLVRLGTLLAEKNLISRGSRGELQVEYLDLRYGNKIYFKPR